MNQCFTFFEFSWNYAERPVISVSPIHNDFTPENFLGCVKGINIAKLSKPFKCIV